MEGSSTLLISVGLLLLFFYLIAPVIRKISGFLIRGIFYSFVMFLVNVVGSSFGFTVGINLITTAICGVFGFYGVIISIISSI